MSRAPKPQPTPRYVIYDLFECHREGGRYIRATNDLPTAWAFVRRYVKAVKIAEIMVIDSKTGKEVLENELA